MTQLGTLHKGLVRVRRYRSTARLGSALAVFGAIVLWFLLGAFVLDLLAHMGRLERSIVLVAFVGVVVWALQRYLLPAFRAREEEVALALMVERQQGIGSDLVAALQFTDSGRPQYGSPELRAAVVQNSDQMANRLNYLEGFSRQEMARRLAILAVTVLIALVPIVFFSAHSRAFANRFFLGSQHYPTDTIIAGVVEPGTRAVYGRPLPFIVNVDVGSVRPEKGTVELTALDSGLKKSVEIVQQPDQPGVYTGQLDRVLSELSYVVYIGDAYTDPATVEIIPLPVVEVDLKIEPPAYAAKKFDSDLQLGRQRVALEGSAVVPVVTSTNKKLKSASIKIGEDQYELKKVGDQFTLTDEDTPLAKVVSTLRYEVQVVDEDDLSLERPISGTLQVRTDQPPRIAVATATQFVLPSASPRIRFGAVDDFALDRITVRKIVERQSASDMPNEVTEVVTELQGKSASVENTVAVNLSELGLKKDDRISLVFEAFDYRGGEPGKSTISDRIDFQVTDRAGILAAMRQLDTQMDKKLDQIIKAQLGIGD